MNTTAAALEANVTAATIRTWCRTDVITAIKRAGRWIIDTASLAHRIAIAAMRARKAQPMTEPVEVRIDDTFTIRAELKTSPAYGTSTWYATLHTNGYATAIPFTGDTAQQAIDRALEGHHAARAEAARKGASIVADLTIGRAGSIHTQLDSLTTNPRQTADGECDTCGLDARTCDCR